MIGSFEPVFCGLEGVTFGRAEQSEVARFFGVDELVPDGGVDFFGVLEESVVGDETDDLAEERVPDESADHRGGQKSEW